MQRSHGESITRLQGGTDLDWDLSENREKHVREEDHGDAKLALEDSTDPRETIWLGLWNRIAARWPPVDHQLEKNQQEPGPAVRPAPWLRRARRVWPRA